MNEKVLIIDDEKDSVEAICDYLELKNISCRGETNPRKAIENFQANPTDIVIVDFVLTPNNSGVTGLDVISELKKIKPFTRFILISGFIPLKMDDDDISKKLSDKAIVDRYIPKPINAPELEKLIRELLTDIDEISENWVSISQEYTADNKVSPDEVRVLNEEIKDSIISIINEGRENE